ncbi:MAG: glycosyltransferase family 9 protein [Actinophytocola sp.]|nr:glycosyltransferase family 9 protein [Actinophytocola sp.]
MTAATDGMLVLRALGLGDLLTGLPALRALRRAFPGHRIALAAPGALAPLVRLAGAADELVPTRGLGVLDWPHDPPAVAVNLHGKGPQSIADLLAQDPAEVLTHRHPDFPGISGPPWPDDVHEVERWCLLLEWFGLPADRHDLRLAPPPRPSPVAGAVVVHPGAAYPARRWPASQFAVVAHALAARGHHVVVTGNSNERPIAADVAHDAGLPSNAVLAGHTDLEQLAAVVAEARLVVCGDTGVGHLATAYDTPSVLLFGPTPPQHWGPPADDDRHVPLWAGGVGDPFGDEPSHSLLRIDPVTVFQEATALLRRWPG